MLFNPFFLRKCESHYVFTLAAYLRIALSYFIGKILILDTLHFFYSLISSFDFLQSVSKNQYNTEYNESIVHDGLTCIIMKSQVCPLIKFRT